MSTELAAWLMIGPLLAYAAFILASSLSRYRVVWVRLSLTRKAFTRRGALRLAEKLQRKHDSAFRVRDVWCGRWVEEP